MTSLVLHPNHDCAPHAVRTLAMACAMALNLTALLIALRPLPLTPLALPSVSPETRANVLDSKPLPVPPLPILRPVMHAPKAATVPTPSPAIASPTPAPALPVTASEPSTISAPMTTSATTIAAQGTSEATIEYATASPPDYPIEALRQGIEGTVLLSVLVDENGKPLQVLIDKTSGSHALDMAAREHVLTAWRFHPAQRNGHAIQAWAQVPVKFDLARG